MYSEKAMTPVSMLLRKSISEVAGRKSMEDIATELGFTKVTLLEMFAKGEAPVPLHLAYKLAQALECRPDVVFRILLEECWPDDAGPLDELLGLSPAAAHLPSAGSVMDAKCSKVSSDAEVNEVIPVSADDLIREWETPGSDGLLDLNFKVTPAFKNTFRLTAAQLRVTQKALLTRCFSEFLVKESRDRGPAR
jgi:hypothetical protein